MHTSIPMFDMLIYYPCSHTFNHRLNIKLDRMWYATPTCIRIHPYIIHIKHTRRFQIRAHLSMVHVLWCDIDWLFSSWNQLLSVINASLIYMYMRSVDWSTWKIGEPLDSHSTINVFSLSLSLFLCLSEKCYFFFFAWIQRTLSSFNADWIYEEK